MSAIDNMRSTNVSPRTLVIAIAIFVVVLIGMTTIVKKMTGHAPAHPASVQSATLQGKSPSSDTVQVKAQVSGKSADLDKGPSSLDDPYAVISDRNLFQDRGSAQVGSMNMSRIPPFNPGGQLPGGFAGFRRHMFGQGGGNKPTDIACTGIVEVPSGLLALLENIPTKESQYVPAGGSAFGYQVANIGDDNVTLSKDGVTTTLNVGENKVNNTSGPSPAPAPAASPTPPTPAAGPPAGMPPDAQNAYRNWRRSRGGGGGGSNQNNSGAGASQPGGQN